MQDEPPKENEGVTFSEDKDYLAEYLELYRQNEDMVGWIKVEDTNKMCIRDRCDIRPERGNPARYGTSS